MCLIRLVFTNKILSIFLLIVALSSVISALGHFSDENFVGAKEKATGNSSIESDEGQLAVLLLIDVSNSMESTDPGNLSETAAMLIVDLLRQDDYVSVIAFDSEAETVVSFEQVKELIDKNEIKSEIRGDLEAGAEESKDFLAAFEKGKEKFDNLSMIQEDKVREISEQLGVDISWNPDTGEVTLEGTEGARTFRPDELREGRSYLERHRLEQFLQEIGVDSVEPMEQLVEDIKTDSYNEVVLFLTDNDPDPDPARREEPGFMDAYMEEFWDMIKNYTLSDIPIYTVGLKETQTQVLDRIAKETRGYSHHLDDSKELAGTFFDIMGEVTNRNLLYKGEIGQEIEKESFEFMVDEYTRQVSLLLANVDDEPGSSDCFDQVELIGPGPGEKQSALREVTEDGYKLFVVDNDPVKSGNNMGEWELRLGSDCDYVKLFAHEENIIDVRVKSPKINSRQSTGEDIDLLIKLEKLSEAMEEIGIEDKDDEDGENFRVEAVINRPDEVRNTSVHLEKDGKYFEGTIPRITEPGEGIITTRVFIKGDLVVEQELKFHVTHTPKLIAPSYLEDVYEPGEDIKKTASLSMKTDKLVEGRNLQVEDFELIIKEEDGSWEKSFPFNDDGEDGDIREDDGIWTSKIELTEEGKYGAQVYVKGIYSGEEFLINKDVGEFNVASRGPVKVILEDGPFWGASGRSVSIDYQIINDSLYEHVIYISSEKNDAWKLNEALMIPSNESRFVSVDLNIPSNLEKGTYSVPIQVATEGDISIVRDTGDLYLPVGEKIGEKTQSQTQSQDGEDLSIELYEVDVEVMSTGELLYKNIGSIITNNPVLYYGHLFGVGLILFYIAGGMFFYSKNVRPFTKLQGYLKYWPQDQKKYDSSFYSGELLINPTQNSLRISFDKNLSGSTSRNNSTKRSFYLYHLDESVSSYELVIKTEPIKGVSEKSWRPPILGVFKEGWESLKSGHYPSKVVAKCTPPGMLMTENGDFRTGMELYHGDRFVTGGYVFQYLNETRKDIDQKVRGENILESYN